MVEPDEIRFQSADAVTMETLWRAFREGFRDYVVPVEIAFDPFVALLDSEHVDLSTSVVALDNGGEPAGVCLLAIRGEDSWCGGLGVAPPWRRQGLGRRLMRRLIDNARILQKARLRLECIDGNVGARALYDHLGFAAIRQLSFFDGRAAAPRRAGDDVVAELGSPMDVWAEFSAYHAHRRPWQQDLPSLELVRDAASLPGVCLGDPAHPDAYLIYRAPAARNGRLVIVDSGSLTDGPDAAASLTALAGAALARYPDASVTSMNVPDDDPLRPALLTHGVPVTLTQTEMVIDL